MEKKWEVITATEKDLEKWLRFAGTVVEDFYDIDLSNSKNYRSAILKNIKRHTAIYIEDQNNIIGAMIYSPVQNHIGWLAVQKQYRRKKVGTTLVNYMFDQLHDRTEYKVKTFTDEEWQGQASHPFYKSLGFEPKELCFDEVENNANHPMLLFVKST